MSNTTTVAPPINLYGYDPDVGAAVAATVHFGIVFFIFVVYSFYWKTYRYFARILVIGALR